MTDVRYEKTASILPNGQVLIAGGEDVDGVLATAELYDPAHGSFTCIGGRSGGPLSLCKPSMIDFRIYAAAVPLAERTAPERTKKMVKEAYLSSPGSRLRSLRAAPGSGRCGCVASSRRASRA